MTACDRLLALCGWDGGSLPESPLEWAEIAVSFIDRLKAELDDFRFCIDGSQRLDIDHGPKAYNCPELVRLLNLEAPNA